MSAVKTSGLTQNALQTAQIVQQATGGATVHNNNRACVTQTMTIDTTTTAPRGMPVLATLDGHQTLNINQDSAYGNNNATEAATSSGSCDTNTTHLLGQSQTIRQVATGSGRIEQDENTLDQGPNLSLDIEQNQNGGGDGPNNTNDAIFSQDNALTAIAKTPIGPVVQTQGTANGGLLASVNQFAHGHSNADAHQTEIQCEHATGSGALNCITGGTVQYNQTQHGPVRKSPGDSLQSGNEDCSPTCDSFTVNQSSTQNNDTHAGQTNLVEGGFSTDGSGTVDQTTTVDGQTTHTTQSGQNVDSTISCSGSSCTTSGGNATVLIAGTGDIGNPEPNDNLTQLLTSAGYSVTESATLPADLSSFGQVWWVDSSPPTSNEQNQLIAFAQSGNGVVLTGERPCCEALNSADQTIVNSVVTGGGITVGGQGDVCGCNAPLPVNPTVVGSVATQPFTVTTWTPAAPGGMANVPASSVFSYYEPDPPTQQVVAAVWDRPSLVGNGRLVVFMDINWPEVAWRAANWSDVAQNVAFFLSGLSSPPGEPVVSGANIATLAPALSVGRAQATPARVPATASGGSTR